MKRLLLSAVILTLGAFHAHAYPVDAVPVYNVTPPPCVDQRTGNTCTPTVTPTLTLVCPLCTGTPTPTATPTPPSSTQYVQVSASIANTTPVVMVATVTGKTFHVVSALVYSTTPTTANFITFSTQTTPLPGCNGNVGYVFDNTQKDWCKTNSAGGLTATESVSAPCNVNVWGYWTAP